MSYHDARLPMNIVSGVGFAIYVVSFFLPAVEKQGYGTLLGWHCAGFVLTGAFQWPPMLGFSLMGLLNPMVLFLTVTRLSGLVRWLSITQVCLILAGVGASWWYLYTESYSILAGHVLWILGIGLLAVPELVRLALPEGPGE